MAGQRSRRRAKRLPAAARRWGACERYLDGCGCATCRQAQRRQLAAVDWLSFGAQRFGFRAPGVRQCVVCAEGFRAGDGPVQCPRCGSDQDAAVRQRLEVERRFARVERRQAQAIA